MQESTGRESLKHENDSGENTGKESGPTSDATVSDLEENDANVGAVTSSPDPGPSPDGALDESEETKGAGPM